MSDLSPLCAPKRTFADHSESVGSGPRACSGPIESGIPGRALKSESIRIDSLLGGGAMARAYSPDMRERVIARVEGGGSRREAAEYYDVSASTAVNWVRCFRETGRCAAKPRGGSTSPLEKHAKFLLALVKAQPDLTLDEVGAEMRRQRISGSRTAVWRFFDRHKISFKKKPARGGAGAHGRGAGTTALDARTGHARSGSAGVPR